MHSMDFAYRLRESGFGNQFRKVRVPFDIRAEEDSESGSGLTLRGLAVPFDSPARINDWFEGEFDEMFKMGSFSRTIEEGGQVMLFEHGEHSLFGTLPVAEIRSLTETKRGLEVEASMYDNWLTEPLRDAINGQSVSGMSIQFRSVDWNTEERDGDVPMVTILDADLRELGPVLFPAYRDTEVGLRSDFIDSVRRGFDLALRGHDGSPRGASTDEPKHTKRNRLAAAKVTLLEMTQ